MSSQKLEEVIASLEPQHRKLWTPAQRSISVDVDLSKKLEDQTHRTITMGDFYEHLTMALFGGVQGETEHLKVGRKEISGRADIIDYKKNRVIESKAVHSQIQVHLLDRQMEFYEALHGKYPDTDILFVIYRHRLKGIRTKWQGTAGELFRELSKKTLYAVVLPYNVVHEVFRQCPADDLTYRYDGESTFDKCANINLHGMTRLLTEPESVVKQLGFNPKSFNMQRYTTPELKVSRYKVQPFPIVSISDS